MRVGIDAHIILPQHKRYSLKIARYTENLILQLLDADKAKEHTWVLFFDQRMKGSKALKKFERENVVIKHFPFVHYRKYLPVLYSHMLIAGFLRAARLDVFHSPEGLIPLVYPGKIITTFHYVPRGKMESNLFVRTFMLGARVAFAQLCKRAKRIIVFSAGDKNLLIERHGYPAERIILFETPNLEKADWSRRAAAMIKMYVEVAQAKKKRKKKGSKKKLPAKSNKVQPAIKKKKQRLSML